MLALLSSQFSSCFHKLKWRWRILWWHIGSRQVWLYRSGLRLLLKLVRFFDTVDLWHVTSKSTFRNNDLWGTQQCLGANTSSEVMSCSPRASSAKSTEIVRRATCVVYETSVGNTLRCYILFTALEKRRGNCKTWGIYFLDSSLRKDFRRRVWWVISSWRCQKAVWKYHEV